jgi:urea transport system permease protein
LPLSWAYPFFASPYDVGNFTYFFIWLFMALGLCLMWGYGGIMSFGQTFFFGLAGYAHGVIAIDLGGKGFTTFEALVFAVLLFAFAAAVAFIRYLPRYVEAEILEFTAPRT